jgi:hypothetical protein
VELKLKTISQSGIPEAIARAEHYRYLNEPEETESICRDIIAVEPENQAALRLLAMAITDQFNGRESDRYVEALGIVESLSDAHKRLYYAGIIFERRAKAQLRIGRPPHNVIVLFEEAMRHFAEADKIRPPGNENSSLRWNRCVRIIESIPKLEHEAEMFEAGDSPPA